jgi:hypothetical protein
VVCLAAVLPGAALETAAMTKYMPEIIWTLGMLYLLIDLVVHR